MWSHKKLQELKAAGKIRGWLEKTPVKPTPAGRIIARVFRKKSKEKEWIERTLFTWCNERSLQLQSEYRFTETRQFRFDWAIPDLMIAVEYEGLMSKKSRHTTATGFSRDTTKYNLAQQLGWKVYRYTALTYKNIINELNHDN